MAQFMPFLFQRSRFAKEVESENHESIQRASALGRRHQDNEPPSHLSISQILMATLALAGWLCAWAWSNNTADMKGMHQDIQKVLENQARDDEWKVEVNDHFNRLDGRATKLEERRSR